MINCFGFKLLLKAFFIDEKMMENTQKKITPDFLVFKYDLSCNYFSLEKHLIPDQH